MGHTIAHAPHLLLRQGRMRCRESGIFQGDLACCLTKHDEVEDDGLLRSPVGKKSGFAIPSVKLLARVMASTMCSR
jgi:hypothetical protein